MKLMYLIPIQYRLVAHKYNKRVAMIDVNTRYVNL